VGEDPICNPVKPQQSFVAWRDLVVFPPGEEKGFRNGIVHRIGRYAASAIGIDMTVKAPVKIEKDSVSGHFQFFRTTLIDPYTPGRVNPSEDIL
jgi:hypothetical protein